jgi:hypothetical protein
MIGFDFDPATHHSVPTLNDLSEDHLAEMRRLEDKDAKVALMYLCHIVERCDVGHAGRFMDDVLFRSADVRSWGRGDRLFLPSLLLIDNVCLPLSESLAPFQGFDRNAWVRIRPTLPARDDRFCGAPGAVIESQPYWYLGPIGFTAVLLSAERDDLEPMTDLTITARRWLASRIAGRLGRRPLPGSGAELAAALGASGPVSHDAEIALEALRREASLGGAAQGMPGFRGPDDWFIQGE